MDIGSRVLIDQGEDCCCGDELIECEIIEMSPKQEAIKVLITDDTRIFKKWFKTDKILEELNKE